MESASPKSTSVFQQTRLQASFLKQTFRLSISTNISRVHDKNVQNQHNDVEQNHELRRSNTYTHEKKQGENM